VGTRWVGDPQKLGRLAVTMRKLAEVPSRASVMAADAIGALIDGQWEAQQDPYGNAWAPLRPYTIAKKGHAVILEDSEVARRGTRVTPLPGGGIAIELGADYIGFHQTGFRVGDLRVPPRPVLPMVAMPIAWREAIDTAVREAMSAVMSGAA
jgi:hypothetical protein